jgi:Gpi18-like mannosyltransferase
MNCRTKRSGMRLLGGGASILAALLLRYHFWPFESGDWLCCFGSYLRYMARNGGYSRLDIAYGNLSPTFTLVLATLSYIPFSLLFSLKALYFVFEVLNAAFVAKLIARCGGSETAAWTGFVLLLFLPSFVLNGSFFAQSDCMYSLFLLLSLLCMTRAEGTLAGSRWDVGALLFFGLAFSLKLQSVFFVLALFFFLVRRHVPLYFWPTAGLPYAAASLPQLLSGRPFVDVFTVYSRQTALYDSLNMNSASLYAVLPLSSSPSAILAAVCGALVVVLLLALRILRSSSPLTPVALLRMAFFSCLLIPYVLPKMHERYFYTAEMFGVALAVSVRFYRFVVPLVCLASSLSYLVYLYDRTPVPLPHLGLMMGCAVLLTTYDCLRGPLGSSSSSSS